MNVFTRMQQVLAKAIGEEKAAKAVEVLQKMVEAKAIAVTAGAAIVYDEEIVAEMKAAKVDPKNATVADAEKAKVAVRAKKGLAPSEKPIDPARASRVIALYGKS